MNYGFIIDNRKCIGCHACTVACKAEHDVPVGVNRTWVKYIEKGEFPNTRRLFSVMRCNHCDDAPCVDICPVEALHTRDDGIVDFDSRRCIGCKACMQACPYDALYIDPQTQTAAKCNYCSHRVDVGLEPACVNVCPEHAIISGDMDNPESEISQLLAGEQVSARKVEKGTRPKLFYIDGDLASMTPRAAAPSPDYLWSSQSSGVGHFSRYAESLIASADPLTMARQLAAGGKVEAASTNTGTDDAVGDAPSPSQKGRPRRVYDAPAKGILWGWEVSTYVWTKAIAAGVILVPFLAQWFGGIAISAPVQWASLAIAMIFMGITGALLVKDLDKPSRFAYVLLRPQWKSWLVRGAYSISLFGLLLLLNISTMLSGATASGTLQFFTAIFAAITAVYTAFLFAQAKGRDFWQSPALALHMLLHAFIAGGAVFAILNIGMRADAALAGFNRLLLLTAIPVNILIMAIEILMPHPTDDSAETIHQITRGRFAGKFWSGSILAGSLLPLLMIWIGGPLLLPLAGILVLIGIYITEHIWVKAPQLIPLS